MDIYGLLRADSSWLHFFIFKFICTKSFKNNAKVTERKLEFTVNRINNGNKGTRVKSETRGTELCPRVSDLQPYLAVSINTRGILGGRSIPRGKWPVAEGLQASEYSRCQRLSLQEWRRYSRQYSAQRWSHHSNWSFDSLRKTKKTKENPAVTVLLPSYSKWAIFFMKC